MDREIKKTLHIFYLEDFKVLANRIRLFLEKVCFAEGGCTFSFCVQVFSSESEILECLLQRKINPDIFLLDICLDEKISPKGGLDVAKKIRLLFPTSLLIMYSHLEEPKVISECFLEGVDEYLDKNTDFKLLPKYLVDAFLKQQHKVEIKKEPESEIFVGNTFKAIASRLNQILDSAITSLHVYGESGTGKELIASYIEQQVGKNVPFVKINCGALTGNLVVSELLGFKKGSFSGASQDQIGILRAADKGWLFFDEIALLNEDGQKALLRAIENREVTPVGSNKAYRIELRILSATNEKLEVLVEKGLFRRDLWQRLCEVEIELPSLRDRKDEVVEIAEYLAKRLKGGPYFLSELVKKILSNYAFAKGNIRELRNILVSATEFLTEGKTLLPHHLPRYVFREIYHEEINTEEVFELRVDRSGFSYEILEEDLFQQSVRFLQKQFPGISLRKLAGYLGMPKTTLNNRLKRNPFLLAEVKKGG